MTTKIHNSTTTVDPQPGDRDLIMEIIHDLDRRVLQSERDGNPQGRDQERQQSAALRRLLDRADAHLGWQCRTSPSAPLSDHDPDAHGGKYLEPFDRGRR